MLIENVVPKREGRLAMPLVLVEDRPAVRLAEQAVA